ncbi:uncharacterized protein KY384_005439 [Bacidia gigantensis]|uniref:uncharacterized protein n=1 Tax=Bacidia gigantensis TaxID=2732470 RepID=UPI001D047F8F|nr:uncharacterized protein KY384_005439 [Bacidia gigantensis]KAG8529958.1 hypothetical protein KY384_005439 [Bacidia gigantensis]
MGIPFDEFDEIESEEALDTCLSTNCHCECHDDMNEEIGVRWEAGVRIHEDEDGPPYDRKGILPFLRLPSEIRDKIYGYAFLQEGLRRNNPYHRGSIHTSLLSTCRQVYKEAGHLPLTINRLCFTRPDFAHDFIGFALAPSVHHLFTKLSVESHISEWFGLNSNLLWKRLKTLPVTHLDITLKGAYGIETLKGHCCFTNAIKDIKTLKTFNIRLVSFRVSKTQNEEIQEELRTKLIDGYVVNKKDKASKLETRAAGKRKEKGSSKAKPAPKRAKKEQSKCSRNTKANSKMHRARDDMLVSYEAMKAFAASLERGSAAVRIRLEEAREAAESLDQDKFESLARSVSSTLEELFAKTNGARLEMLRATGALGNASGSLETLRLS